MLDNFLMLDLPAGRKRHDVLQCGSIQAEYCPDDASGGGELGWHRGVSYFTIMMNPNTILVYWWK